MLAYSRGCSEVAAVSFKIFKYYFKHNAWSSILILLWRNFKVNRHGAEISVIWLVKRSAIKLLILHVTREK